VREPEKEIEMDELEEAAKSWYNKEIATHFYNEYSVLAARLRNDEMMRIRFGENFSAFIIRIASEYRRRNGSGIDVLDWTLNLNIFLEWVLTLHNLMRQRTPDFPDFPVFEVNHGYEQHGNYEIVLLENTAREGCRKRYSQHNKRAKQGIGRAEARRVWDAWVVEAIDKRLAILRDEAQSKKP
jgi:hypothetical protein